MANIKDAEFRSLRELSAKDILVDLKTRHEEWNKEEHFVKFLETHLFFITVKFNLDQIVGWRSDLTKLIGEFGKLYFETSKQLLGNNLGRKRHLQPRTFAYTDFEGTRSRKKSIDILKSGFPHVHAVALVRSEHSFRFPLTLQNRALIMQSVKDCDVRLYDRHGKTVEELVEYCMKGYLRVPQSYSGREDLWQFYPR